MRITNARVKRYRSLYDVSMGGLSNMVIFYGHNDTGKSNVLSFFEHLFQSKIQITERTGNGEREFVEERTAFWRGEIDRFDDCFYMNGREPIEFSVTVKIAHAEIEGIESIPAEFIELLDDHDQHALILNGRIEKLAGGRGEVILESAVLAGKAFFGRTDVREIEYLPGFEIDARIAKDSFDGVMDLLTDSFKLVPAVRYFARELEVPLAESSELQHGKIKNWLFHLSLDKEQQSAYHWIVDQFGAEMFGQGLLTLTRTGERLIDIYIENDTAPKLPIGKKGSGVQQILLILAYIASPYVPMIGIEEVEMNLSPESQYEMFDALHGLIQESQAGISQVMLTTHSPFIAKRNEAERRVVVMNDGKTVVAQPGQEEIEGFFRLTW